MFTSQTGFDNVHAQKSRLVMVSPEPNFWIHACVDLAKTPKAAATKSTQGADPSEDFDYHGNSLNDDVLRTQLMQAFQNFKLQYGGFYQIMQSEGIRALERRIESFFTPWAWQWNLGATPEFGAYLGLPIHPLKKQLSPHIDEYLSHVPDTPTLILAPPHIMTTPALTSISPLPPLARFLEQLVPSPKPKPPPPTPSPANDTGTSTPKHMLMAGGNAVTKYITKPAAQVVDPRNWSWPTYMTFGKGSLRSKDKERGKIPTIDTNVEGVPSTPDEKPLQDKQKELLGVPVDQDTVSKASRSVSPSTIDHESLREAQQDSRLATPEPSADVTLNLALSTPLPADSDSEDSPTHDSNVAEHALTTPRATVKSPPLESPVDTETNPNPNPTNNPAPGSTEINSNTSEDAGLQLALDKSSSEAPQSNPLPVASVVIGEGDTVAPPAAPETAPVQVEFSTRVVPETISGSLDLWLDSARGEDEGGPGLVTENRKVTWIAVPGLLVASVVNEDHESIWRNAAQELLFSLDETIQSRQLTVAETTLRALSTTKVIAHYPASQMSASSVLPQFTSDSPHLFTCARALQFSTAPNIREIVTQTRWGTWCAARQSTPGTRLYVEIDRKEANLVDVDQELGSACRRWEDTDA
ncbi:hypothetical protein FS749_011998 [Ceratobasidium sp. UAMH 11750]|nr:hypothetical protein FS749_011998 [Ceratobasidium sp. UAMH 11750]